MTSFAQILETRSQVPERHVVLPPSSFASDWSSKPAADLALGLRRISDADLQVARAEAAKFAIEMHDDEDGRIEAFNDALMRWMIVRGTCDANDIRINAPIFDGSEENVRNALTYKAIRFVWDHIDRFHIELSPIVPEATDAEFLEFGVYLKMPQLLDTLPLGSRTRFRKLIGFMLDELRTHDPNNEAAEGDDALLDDDG